MTGVETALLVGAVASAAATAFGTVSAVKQSNYQASVAKMNAKIEQDNAKRAIEAGLEEAATQDRINAGIFGEQLNTQAGSGLSTGSGSFALDRKAIRELGRQDTLNVAQRGFLQAHNSQVAAAQYRADASAAKSVGRGALIGGILGTAGNVAGAYSTPIPGSTQTLGQSLIGRATSSRQSIRYTRPR